MLLIEQCLNGVQYGLLLFLVAAGLTLVFGIMDLVNLAHGSFYMLGAYFAASFVARTGSFVLGCLLAVAATLAVGMVVEWGPLRRLYGRPHLDHVLGTFGLLLFFNDLVRLVWGPAGMNLPLPPYLSASVEILPDVFYPRYRLVVILAALGVAAFLYGLVMRTRTGMLIRAGAGGREMVGALGVNIRLLYTFVFGLGAALAGLAGLIEAPVLTAQIGMGDSILIVALVVIVIGGLGSIRGAFAGALFVGLVDTLGRAFLPDLFDRVMSAEAASTLAPAVASMLIYLVMAVLLVLRPEGLFPVERPGGLAAAGEGGRQFPGPPAAAMAVLILALALLPAYVALTGQVFALTLVTRILILALAATSLNLILGYGGLVSFGHAAYLGIGGYAVGILAREGIASGFLQWGVAILASGLVALVVGAVSLRTRGAYFIMITLAFAQMIYYVASGLDRYGGDDGLTIYRAADFGGLFDPTDRVQLYYLSLALLLGALWGVARLVGSRFGMVLRGAQSNERRLAALGIAAYRYRLLGFVLAGMMCGLSGALLATFTTFVSPAVMDWTRTGDLIVMIVLGGVGTLFGPLLGAVVLLLLQEGLSAVTEYQQLIIGPLLLLVVLRGRGGLGGLLGRAAARPALQVSPAPASRR